MSIFLKLFWFFKQEWRRYAIAIVALIGVGLITMLPPWLIGVVVDLIGSGDLTRELLWYYLGWMALAAVVAYVLRVVWRIALFGASYKLANQLRQSIFQHLTKQPPAFFQTLKTGDLMARSTNDIQAVEMTAGEAVLALFDGAFTGIIVLIVMTLFISWPLTVLALIPWPIVGFFMWRFGTELHHSFKDAQARFSDLNDDVQESISALRLTRAFGREQVEEQQFNDIATAANVANQAVAKTDSKYDPVIQLGVGFSFLLSVAGGAYYIHLGELTTGQLLSFTLYLGYMIWPMFAVGWLLNMVERGSAAYERIEQLLRIEPAIADSGTFNDRAEPSLQMRIPSFCYADGTQALSDIGLTLPAGHLLGIVGPVGAGKTTLLNLLLRAEEGDRAELSIGGHDVGDFTLHNLRSHVATVPQNAFLFSSTVAENIALAKPDATQDEVEAVARIAQVHDDILRFPNGYQTEVGERGVTLSGGQKQRISIARALLLDAPILILDDALSAVDVRTEQQILAHLSQARAGKTTVIVCHRLSAVENADHIIVLDHGRMTESGTHAELLAEQGWYRQTYEYQQLEQAVEEGR
ncbi:multidrug ABC transporter permease/ATP-binding protein [Bacterioplanes sanyensis]|uniref:Multidrug resistance-like ATP-binding protein MdlA n=1 Tax=Bacterioplanes sanyensis TaxID=1249553 RepID=A0A222FLF4_9GAMM|nr:ABC transporter transmembrane domain-containing protein [Bacterioplanes sanyensis]ASP39502.1 multidrug ABC transporter permease/ATP-binding protein [Bacterioplanes sanyensis]